MLSTAEDSISSSTIAAATAAAAAAAAAAAVATNTTTTSHLAHSLTVCNLLLVSSGEEAR